MTTTRQRIIGYLRKTRTASPQEMARALDMTAANVRHHLGVLLADGRVALTALRKEGRGRPVKLYSLAGALAGDNLPGLLDGALAEWLGSLGPAQQAAALRSLGRRMAEGMQPQGLPLPKQLALTIENLNRLQYAARWEAGAGGPHVILGQCPYAALIARHPELCQADAALLERMLGTPVEQRSKLHPTCVFALG